jgi:hypothetical protein
MDQTMQIINGRVERVPIEESRALQKEQKLHYMFHDRSVKNLQQVPPPNASPHNITHPTQDKNKLFGKNTGVRRNDVLNPNDNRGRGYARADSSRHLAKGSRHVTTHKAANKSAPRSLHAHKVKKN